MTPGGLVQDFIVSDPLSPHCGSGRPPWPHPQVAIRLRTPRAGGEARHQLSPPARRVLRGLIRASTSAPSRTTSPIARDTRKLELTLERSGHANIGIDIESDVRTLGLILEVATAGWEHGWGLEFASWEGDGA
jgi:hypothetical protein